MIKGIPQILPELDWFLVADRMDRGFSLYAQIWDDIAPLSAYFYWFVFRLFGNQALALQIITTVLILVQAFMFNHFLRKREIYSDRTLIPVLLYVTLMNLFIDFYTLNPVLLANTFLLIAIRYIFIHINERKKYNAVFEIGAYIGIATLFYLPSFLVLIVPFMVFILYTGTPFKDYFLMFFAFLFTIGIAILGFYLNNTEYDFYINFFQSLFYLKPQFLMSFPDLVKILILPIFFSILGIVNTQLYRRYSNYQHRSQFVMNSWLMVSFLTVFLNSKVSAYSFILVVPAFVFILTHYLLMLRVTFYKEAIYMLILISSLYFLYSTLYNTPLKINIPLASWTKFEVSIATSRLLVKPHPRADLLKGKRILVTGDAPGNYQGAYAASPYLNWRLAQRHFDKINQFFNIKTTIYYNIFDNPARDIPEVIVDIDGVVPVLFRHLPLAAQEYEKVPDTQPLLYIRKKNSLSSTIQKVE